MIGETTMLTRMVSNGCVCRFEVGAGHNMLRLIVTRHGYGERVYTKPCEQGTSALIAEAFRDFEARQ